MRVLLAMAVLLFLSPRHGRAAYQIQGSSGETLTRKRSAPETTWVKSLAQRHGLLHLLGDQRMDKHSSGQMAASGKVPRAGLTSLRALAAITPGQLGRGVLTEWGAQEEYLRNFLYEGERFLHSVFSLQVVRIVAFSRPFDSNSPIRFTSDLWEPDKLEYADFLQRSGLDRQGLRRGLGVCSEDIAAFLQQPLAMRVPLLPLELLCKGEWTALVLNGNDFMKKGPFLQRVIFRTRLG